MQLTESFVWDGQLPGDLRLVFHRLDKKGIRPFLVGPAVRDALTGADLERIQRVDILAISPAGGTLERTLDSVATEQFFLSRPERFRRNVSFNIQEEGTGNFLRRLVFTEVGDESQLLTEVSKREVTVNALLMDGDLRVYDPYRGHEDLKNQRIRTILPPSVAFAQKPLNLVKVAKHIAYHGFDADSETEIMAARHAMSILDVPIERIRPEVERLLVNLYPDRGLQFLERSGVLPFLFPELQALVGFEQSCDVHHKDIWDHTCKVVARAKPSPAIRWAALFHDIGKVWTRSVDEQGHVHFFRHEEMSGLLFKGIAARIELEPRLSDKVRFLINNHSRINMYTGDWTDSAVRRLIRETQDHLTELLNLSRADITSRQERKVEELTRLLDDLEERARVLLEQDAKEPLLPRGTGDTIMRHFGLTAGPVVGQLKDKLEEALEAGILPKGLPADSYMGFLEGLVRKEGRTT